MNLPAQLIYDLDIDMLNDQYGEGNWRIAKWHEHYVVEKIENPLYVKKILTPVISSGLEHVMTTVPYRNPLNDRTYISASILADILYRKFVLALKHVLEVVPGSQDLQREKIMKRLKIGDRMYRKYISSVPKYLV